MCLTPVSRAQQLQYCRREWLCGLSRWFEMLRFGKTRGPCRTAESASSSPPLPHRTLASPALGHPSGVFGPSLCVFPPNLFNTFLHSLLSLLFPFLCMVCSVLSLGLYPTWTDEQLCACQMAVAPPSPSLPPITASCVHRAGHCFQRIPAWFGLGGTLKLISFHPLP